MRYTASKGSARRCRTTHNLQNIEPFEICSIRPPTENYSLTFRLTRNCAWNRCLFCPVYKLGARFSKRPIEEVERDVDRAAVLDELLMSRNLSCESYREAGRLIQEIDLAPSELVDPSSRPRLSEEEPETAGDEDDERLQWFASWFRDKPTIEGNVHHLLAWRSQGARTCFLGDANALLLPGEYMAQVLSHIRCRFPTIERFTVYGRTQSAARKEPEELALFARSGLNRIHFGLESGSDTVLRFMKKGVTAAQHIEACQKTRDAGISCSVYVMPGLGGAGWSEEHALETARVLTEARPDFVRLRTLELFPGTGLAAAARAGEFAEAPEEQVAREIRTLVEHTRTDTTIVSDSASNLLDVNGRLPEERARMLSRIDEYLSLSRRGKLLFSLHARLQSFVGQYGGLTQDILDLAEPYVSDGRLDSGRMSDEGLVRAIRVIRSKLMP